MLDWIEIDVWGNGLVLVSTVKGVIFQRCKNGDSMDRLCISERMPRHFPEERESADMTVLNF